MPRYELDDYVQEHVADDAVNANCVVSWRARTDVEGRVESLSVDLHNSFSFDSRHGCGRKDAPGRMLRALQRNGAGESATLGQHRISAPISGRTPPVIGGPSRTDTAVLPVLEPHASLVKDSGRRAGAGN